MKRIGAINHVNYSADKLSTLFRTIELADKTDQKQDYEMVLDHLKIIPRTSDLERFNSFSEFITHDSECLTVYLYFGASKQYDTYFFHFNGVPASKNKSQNLSGTLSAEEFEQKQREKILKDLNYERLEKENIDLKIELEELEEKYKTQELHWEKIKSGRIESYGDIGSAIVLKLLSNPNIQKMIPGADTLGGILNPTEKSVRKNTPPEEGASFSRADGGDNQLSEQDKAYLIVIRDMVELVKNESQLENIMQIIRLLTLNPVAIPSTIKHIENFLKNDPY